MAGGRPTKYKAEYCQNLIDHMALGHSFESFASDVNVNIDTLYHWTTLFPEFSEAKKIGKVKSLKLLEKIGMQGMLGKVKGFNVAAWIFTCKNRHPDIYSEQITIANDKPIVLKYSVNNKLLPANAD